MTRNHSGSYRNSYSICNEEFNLQSLSLRKFGVSSSSRCSDLSVKSTLLGSSCGSGGDSGSGSGCSAVESKQKRRERVTRSWNGGYGTLVEGKEYNHNSPSSVHQLFRNSAATPSTREAADVSRRSRIDLLLMPSLKSLVSRRPSSSRGSSSRGAADMGGSSSSSGVTSANKSKSAAAMVPLMRRDPSCSSMNGAASASGGSGGGGGGLGVNGGASSNMRKCETVLALSSLLRSASSSRTTLHVEPLKAVNRLRVSPGPSRMCSRCSSLLSMASSSRYSLNTAGFVPVPSPEPLPLPLLLCKLCLSEVPASNTCHINHCNCTFCKDCIKAYIEFEIQEGAYDISCPDAQCEKQGVISLSEIENLVTVELVEKHRKFRLNREVDLDTTRTWCPRAGCETVCAVCPMERCLPQSVHCPTCSSDFCSNCKNPWHAGLTCEENSRRLAKEGRTDLMEPGIPFDSDLIKCCPMCNVPIEKDEGCAQMMCKRCKHVFCWYCLASLDDDFLLRHYDKGPCKNKLGHSRASVIWHRTQVIGIFAGFGILLLVASPLLLLAAPCIVCCKCRICSGGSKLDSEDEMPEESAS
ncbi:E3 ubiquitin-protein ligase RNF144B [Anabrus simplex]|uniref:E3 ubiquitin-protein ligase RNF144B n=1 Tax=Anabrus simplex TaxID=316456 RepID=UPI0034DD8CD3